MGLSTNQPHSNASHTNIREEIMSCLLQKQSSNQNLTSKLCNASTIVPSMQAKNFNDDQKILLNANILKNIKEKEYAGTDHC